MGFSEPCLYFYVITLLLYLCMEVDGTNRTNLHIILILSQEPVVGNRDAEISCGLEAVC